MPLLNTTYSPQTPESIDVIILAAGKGTRMPSKHSKALQTLLGEAMISHVYHALLNIGKKSTSAKNSPQNSDLSFLEGIIPPKPVYRQFFAKRVCKKLEAFRIPKRGTHFGAEFESQCLSNRNDVHDITFPFSINNIWTVVGHEAEAIKKHLHKEYGQKSLDYCVYQDQQLGTGHAVLCVLNALNRASQNKKVLSSSQKIASKILVLNADTPLISTKVLENFIIKAKNIPLAFMSLILDEPASYGRVQRANYSQNLQKLLSQKASHASHKSQEISEMREANSGTVERIVEAKDFRKEFNQENTGAEIYEVNAGIYLFDYSLLSELLPQISTENVSGEYYLTDIVGLAHRKNYLVEAFSASTQTENQENLKNTADSQRQTQENSQANISSNEICTALLGVNTPSELAKTEALLQEQEIQRRLQEGIIIHSPQTVRISPFAVIEKGVEIFGPCEIYGKTFIGENTRIESHSYIENTHIANNCHIRSFCHFVDAYLGARTNIGPYARLRPEANLAEDVHVGNFVEIKKSTIKIGSKINHLSYIGDSEIGSGVNVGAGCITCNYDGVHKHKTTIEDNAFLGSNCAFVAPVKIGKNSLIGAGSVITKDVADETLAIARARQQILKKFK